VGSGAGGFLNYECLECFRNDHVVVFSMLMNCSLVAMYQTDEKAPPYGSKHLEENSQCLKHQVTVITHFLLRHTDSLLTDKCLA
jgi:hypothetical protein